MVTLFFFGGEWGEGGARGREGTTGLQDYESQDYRGRGRAFL